MNGAFCVGAQVMSLPSSCAVIPQWWLWPNLPILWRCSIGSYNGWRPLLVGENGKWIESCIQLRVVKSNLTNARIYHLIYEVFIVVRLPRLMLHLPLFELSFHSPVDTYHEEPSPIGGSWLLDVHKIWGMYRSMPAPWSCMVIQWSPKNWQNLGLESSPLQWQHRRNSPMNMPCLKHSNTQTLTRHFMLPTAILAALAG